MNLGPPPITVQTAKIGLRSSRKAELVEYINTLSAFLPFEVKPQLLSFIISHYQGVTEKVPSGDASK